MKSKLVVLEVLPLVVLASVFATARPTAGQDVSPSNATAAWAVVTRLSVGQDVRLITSTGESIDGTLRAVDGSSITLSVAGQARTTSQQHVQRLLVVRERDRWRHVWIGAAVGGVTGSIAVAVHCHGASSSCSEVAPAYVLPGVAVGAAIGALLPKRNVWQEIYVRP